MKKIILLSSLTAFLVIAGYTLSEHTHDGAQETNHSGRTNSSGCHNDYVNGGYHCH